MNEEIQNIIIDTYCRIMENNMNVSLDEDLQWDSFDKMQFVVLIEEKTETSLDDILVKIVEAQNLKEVIEAVSLVLK